MLYLCVSVLSLVVKGPRNALLNVTERSRVLNAKNRSQRDTESVDLEIVTELISLVIVFCIGIVSTAYLDWIMFYRVVVSMVLCRK